MLKDIISVAAIESGVEEPAARHAVGIILNAAQRQGGDLIERIFAQVPGAVTKVAASTGLVLRTEYFFKPFSLKRCSRMLGTIRSLT